FPGGPAWAGDGHQEATVERFIVGVGDRLAAEHLHLVGEDRRFLPLLGQLLVQFGAVVLRLLCGHAEGDDLRNQIGGDEHRQNDDGVFEDTSHQAPPTACATAASAPNTSVPTLSATPTP